MILLRPTAKLAQLTGANIYKIAEPSIESGIKELNKFLARLAVKKALKEAKITNVWLCCTNLSVKAFLAI